jgi:hypothetical protein
MRSDPVAPAVRSSRRRACACVATSLAIATFLAACQRADEEVTPYTRHGSSFGSGGGADVVDPGPLVRFAPPPENPGPGAVLFTVSGEALARAGYGFPPATPDAVAFVDGWEVRFDRLLVTVGGISLSANPDRSPGDPSQTEGQVASAAGPWAVDLHRGGPLTGKAGGGEQSVPIASVEASLDPTQRYAFGYDVVPATLAAQNVNLDAAALAAYAQMIAKGCTVLYDGTATFRGMTCAPSSPVLDGLPPVVHFQLCFQAPTSYLNCQNPDNDPATPFEGEEHQRGIAIRANTFTIAQLTIHTDHPFWESTQHDAPAHFDPLAAHARAPGRTDAGPAEVTLDDLTGVDFTSFTDASGAPLPARSCVTSYTPAAGVLRFDANGVAHQPPAGDPSRGLRDYPDLMTYDLSTQGHLNSDGLCFVRRGYPSPP